VAGQGKLFIDYVYYVNHLPQCQFKANIIVCNNISVKPKLIHLFPLEKKRTGASVYYAWRNGRHDGPKLV